jgi:transformation/transcription domain-associated protein
MVHEEITLSDSLHPIFDRLLRLYPIPKEDEEPRGEMSDFHTWISSAIGDGLRNAIAYPRSTLMMLKSVVQVTPEKIEPFAPSLIKLYGKCLKDHNQIPFGTTGYDNTVRLIILILDICQIAIAHLGDHRRNFHSGLTYAMQSKSPVLCQYILDMARSWALGPNRNDLYPTTKDKAALIQNMHLYEPKGPSLFNAHLQLVYDIYTSPSLRRSDLTSRLEGAFLLGCRAKDPELRDKFVDLLDSSIPRSLFSRLVYISSVQSWDAIADHNWIHLALHLLLGAADSDISSFNDSQELTSLNYPSIPRPKTQAVVRPLQRIVFQSSRAAGDLWASVFSAGWTCLTRSEQTSLTVHMNNLLSREYHLKQTELRPNVIQALLQGVHACSPPMVITPHVVKYLAKTFGAWHVGLEILTSTLDNFRDDDQSIRDSIYDSLAEVYSELGEEDMFYGLSRNRCLFPETNVALAYEQNGMWEQASVAYEHAQHRARSGAIAFSEPEFCLWEDQWVLSCEKLQQWEILYELAKNEGNIPQLLESAWRTKDWGDHIEDYEGYIEKLPEATPRRQVFEAFMALLKNPSAVEKNQDFTRALEEAMQLSLRKWVALPPHLSAGHVPLLQHFQQFVELQEAVQIFGSLHTTNASNLEKKSSELKMVLQAWRERLPNHHDDINVWSDLLGWRQNVFHSINRTYIPLLQNGSNGAAATNTSSTFGYRGYHETAWIINRFAHVARKHQLLDACFTSLAKIYTLPNIEISEAFLKLREQARCYYQKQTDLQAGLEVINNTNLAYFSTAQKAEFFTLKGMFFSKAGRQDEANAAFGTAVQLDMQQAKAWAEWGRWNDRMFSQTGELTHAANAVGCYLQAAGLYKNGKSRPLQARILWLLSLDDATLTVSRSFDTYKGEAAFWYWISLVHQLCSSLAYREVKQARYVLITISRHWPQVWILSMDADKLTNYIHRQ